MDATWFLKQRTKFIRFYYDECVGAFAAMQAKIEHHEPPFDEPHYDESGEPSYMPEWMEARTGIDLAGLTCVSLLSDSLKLYFQTLQHRVIGFALSGTDQELKGLRRPGFLKVYKRALGEILQTDWTDCPVDFGIIEQVVLARNRAQHGSDLTSLRVAHDLDTLKKYPRPFFASEEEMRTWTDRTASPATSSRRPSRSRAKTSLRRWHRPKPWPTGLIAAGRRSGNGERRDRLPALSVCDRRRQRRALRRVFPDLRLALRSCGDHCHLCRSASKSFFSCIPAHC
jgi:hypothetical protein